MDSIFFETKQLNFLSPPQPPSFLHHPLQTPYLLHQPPPPPPPTSQSSYFNLNKKVSPSVLLTILIVAIIFFISCLLHLLVRFLLRPPNRDADDVDNVTVLQGQLRQLFHLHDAGVDQSFIGTLPVFNYKAIIGVKKPFDCAVCLCEFEPEDRLRLLPKCSHAFHLVCIETWLLSHSTCPLCRASLLPDFSPNHVCSPLVLVLESGSHSSREIVSDRDGDGDHGGSQEGNSHLGFHCRDELGSSRTELSYRSCEIQAKDEADRHPVVVVIGSEEKVVPAKLGKFRNVDDGGGEGTGNSNNNSVDARRCFSMGSFAYIMHENSPFQVLIKTPMKKQSTKKPSLPLIPGHRPAMSECDCHSRREFNGLEPFKSVDHIQGIGSISGNGVGRSKRESFSVSKIWLRAKKEKPSHRDAAESSRRAFSFRFPVHRNVVSGDGLKPKNSGSVRRTISEIDIGRWGNGGGGSGLGLDEENQSCDSLDSQTNPPSFARRTLLWLAGRQNKVVHSSFSPNL